MGSERQEESAEGFSQRSGFADRIIDDLVPRDLEWRKKVRSYPLAAMTLASLGGFFLGRNHGKSLLMILTDFGTREVSRNIVSLLDAERGGPVWTGDD